MSALSYFEANQNRRKSIENPNTQEIYLALNSLFLEEDTTSRVVRISKTKNDSRNVTQSFLMEAFGDRNGVIITVSLGDDIFAQPDFDKILGRRGKIVVIGDYWDSTLVCTNIDIATEIMDTFSKHGKLAYPEIWNDQI